LIAITDEFGCIFALQWAVPVYGVQIWCIIAP